MDAEHNHRVLDADPEGPYVSHKLQEEERKRCMDFVPDVSTINTDHIKVDKEMPTSTDFLVATGFS